MSESTLAVSVLLITYNHAKFVAQALDSILMQQADFDFEIVVADDGSTDRTFEIIRGYADRDSRIRLLPSESNMGISRNYKRGFAACRGAYVAVLEGDDYWISPRKLQLTAAFLDHNSSCSFCFHRNIRYDYLPESTTLFPPHWTVEQHFTARELAEGNFIGGFSTCVYRRRVLAALKPELWDLDIREWFFNIVVSEHGPIGYLPQVLSIYRVHEGGIWGALPANKQAAELDRLIESYDQFLDRRFTAQFQKMRELAATNVTRSPIHASMRGRMVYWRMRIWLAQRLPPGLKHRLKRFVR